MKQLKIILMLVISALLVGCDSKEPPKKQPKSFEIQAVPLHKTLYFTGTIQPLRENALSSPVDATVDALHYHYGQPVKKGQVVATLNSSELQKQYHETLTDYLKAKDSFTVAKAKFSGTEDLWQAGLLAKNHYLMEKSSVDNARVALMQATRKLSDLMEKTDAGNYQNLSSLSLAEFDKVRRALSAHHNLIHLKATSDGLLLYPPKSGDEQSGRLSVGAQVKAGQSIALIGDLRGIRVEIDVPEVDIVHIKPGMPATIRGVAFANEALQGKVVAVNAQASATSSGALPSFTAVIEVSELKPEQQQVIKVGMSAAIELAIDSGNKLLVPIAAVKQQQGQSVVQVLAANGIASPRTVTTGAATADKVAINTGLQEGETVLYD